MKKISAYEIALAALSCALSTIFLTIGVYSGLFLFTAYLAASIALMLPLCQQSWRGFIFAYIATSLLSLVFASFRFWELLPFVMFFGLHPLVNELQLKTKINRWIACLVKALWFDGTIYYTWKVVFAITTSIALIDKYILLVVFVFGTLLFIAYDYFMFKWRIWATKLVHRISKK